MTTLVSGSPIIQDGKLLGAVTHVILLASRPKIFGRAMHSVLQNAKRGRKYRSKGGAIRNFIKIEKAIPDVSRFTATLYWG